MDAWHLPPLPSPSCPLQAGYGLCDSVAPSPSPIAPSPSAIPSASSSPAAASASPLGGLPESNDGSCGAPNYQFVCGNDNCCSRFGYCGSTDAYCGTGCQPGYGRCPATLTATATSTAAQAPQSVNNADTANVNTVDPANSESNSAATVDASATPGASSVAGIAVAVAAFAAVVVVIAVVVLRRRRASKRVPARFQTPVPVTLAQDVEATVSISPTLDATTFSE